MKTMKPTFTIIGRTAQARVSTHCLRWCSGLVTACVLLALAVSSVPAWAGADDPATRKLDKHLQAVLQQPATGAQRVLVQTAPGAGPAVAEAARKQGRRANPAGDGGDLLSMTVASNELADLAGRPDVARISSDAIVRPHGDVPSAVGTSNHLLNTLGLADSPWNGASIGVVVIDSGIAANSNFKWTTGFWDFTQTDDLGNPLDPRKTVPYDDYGHGTHVAGLIANKGNFAEGVYRGVAPYITLYAMKVLDREGRGLTSNVIRAIDFCVANKDNYWIDVINLSLGHPILEPAATDPLVQAVERAVRAGIVVVASAGNFGRNPETGVVGYAGITSPGNAPSAITVGAIRTQQSTTRDDDVIPDFSSRGPTWFDGFQKPDVVAPGAQLVANVSSSSSLYLANPNLLVETVTFGNSTTPYLRLSGTSMAAAVTTGVVAQMLDASFRTLNGGWGRNGAKVAPTLPPNAVKAILQYTALPLPGYDTLTQGAGALNGEGAVRLAAAIDTRAPLESWWMSPAVGPAHSAVGDSLYIWSSRVIWGDRVIEGDVVFQNDPAWDAQALWGDRAVWGDRVIWRDSLVFGDPAAWATRVVWGDALIGYDSGTEILWGDRVIWGNRVVGGDRVIWGDLTHSLFALGLIQ